MKCFFTEHKVKKRKCSIICSYYKSNQLFHFLLNPFGLIGLCYAHFNISVLLTFFVSLLVFYTQSLWIYGVDYLVK